MDSTYDVIVLGAGNAGLAAAAYLVKAGLKVLVLEKHNLPGGCASSFVRGRFEFETALHELCFVGSAARPGRIYRMFEELGIDVDWRYDDNLFRAVVKGENGYDVTVRGGREGFISSVAEAVPEAKAPIESLLALADSNEATTQYLNRKHYHPSKLKMFLKHKDFMRSASHSLLEVEKALGVPKSARTIINTYWSYLGAPSDDINAMHFLSMLRSYIDDGAAMPHLRSYELSAALADYITSHGGEILYNTPVTGLTPSDDNGPMTVRSGEQTFAAKEIISNIIPDNVYSMMDQKNIPASDVRLANAREYSISAFAVYIGLDASADELGIEDYTVFIMDDAESRKQHDERSVYIVNCLNRVIPDCSPEGTCMLFFTIPCYGSDLPQNLTPSGYHDFKLEVAREYIRDYEETMHVDVMSHIEEIEVATPATFARYIGSPDGSIYGYKLSGWDNLIARILDSSKDHTVPHLTFAGGHGEMGSGFSSTYINGMDKAAEIVSKLSGGSSE